MSNKWYIAESQHERNIIERYAKMGMNHIRAAGSKGLVDAFVWDEKGGIFIFSRSRIWPERERLEHLKRLKMFPNSIAVFVEKYRGHEDSYIYRYTDWLKLKTV